MTVGIAGLGLIGGSIGLALRDPSRRIVGCDPSPEHERIALGRFCVDEIVPLAEVAQADLVFVAAPPVATVATVRALLNLKADATVITDCASVKSQIVAEVDHPQFVGGHPMAGHEKSGPKFSSAWMFREARWILTPTKKTAKPALKLVEETVRLMGAVPVRIPAPDHDRHVAILSHLPHVLAGVLVQLGEELDHADAGGGSWRDLTRVGGVDPGLWTQILAGNRQQVGRVLANAEQMLADVRRSLEQEDDEAVRGFFERAKLAKAKHEA